MTHVRIYTRQGCPYSAGAKRLLEEKGIPYEEVDVTAEPHRREEMLRLTGGRSTFPQVFFGTTHVGGYTELAEYDRTRGVRTLLADAGGEAASP
jgi:glutaredoxin 3